MVKQTYPTREELKKEITTIQVSKDTLRILKLRKTVLDFDTIEELILYALEFTPNGYTTKEKREKPKNREGREIVD